MASFTVLCEKSLWMVGRQFYENMSFRVDHVDEVTKTGNAVSGLCRTRKGSDIREAACSFYWRERGNGKVSADKQRCNTSLQINL